MVGNFFNIGQTDRGIDAGVARAAALLVGGQALSWVLRRTSIKGPIDAFEDVTVVRHQ